jgi:hypothetical protein
VSRELQLLAGNLEVAWSQGRLNDFFNTAHNNSSYMALVQLIADSAVRLLSAFSPLFEFRQLVTAEEFLKSIREAEVGDEFRSGLILTVSQQRQKLHCSSLYGGV